MSKWTSTDQMRVDAVSEALIAFRKYHLRWSVSLRRLSPSVVFEIPAALDEAAEKLSARERMALPLANHTVAFTIVDAEVTARFVFGTTKKCFVEANSRPRYDALAAARSAFRDLGFECPWTVAEFASLDELRQIPSALAALPKLSCRQMLAIRQGRAKIEWATYLGKLVAVLEDERDLPLGLFDEAEDVA